MNIYRKMLVCIVVGLMLSSCTERANYKMATSSKSASYLEVGQELAFILEQDLGTSIQVLSNESLGSNLNVKLLAQQEVDFALAQGDTRLEHGEEYRKGSNKIRTILPLYPEILFIIYPDSIKASSLEELVKGRRVGLGPAKGGTASFMQKLFDHYGISKESYTAVYTPYNENVISGQIDISCALTGYNNDRVFKMLIDQHHKIFSLGEVELAFKGSSVDGFCLVHGPARPFIIPKSTYMSQPHKPVLTVAVDATLLAHESIDKYLVHNIVASIFNNKQFLASLNTLFSGLTEEFDYNNLNYPLHEGARMYLERDKPSFVERHGKLLGSILLAIVTGIPMLYRWNQQRKKDSIDRFYNELMEIEDVLEEATDLETVRVCEKRVKKVREAAYDGLINEKLDANPSFRIFTDLLKEVRDVLDRKKREF